MAGNRAASQNAGVSAGDALGEDGKAEAPSTSHHLLFAQRCSANCAIILGVIGIATQELLCEAGKSEIGPLVRGALAPVVHCAPH